MPKPKGAMGSPFCGMAESMAAGFDTVGTNNNNRPVTQFTPEELKTLIPKLTEVGEFVKSSWVEIIILVDGVRLRVQKLEKL